MEKSSTGNFDINTRQCIKTAKLTLQKIAVVVNLIDDIDVRKSVKSLISALGKEFALCAHFIRGIIIRRPLTCLCESIMYVITDLKKLPILSGRKRKHVLERCNRESFNHRNGQQTGPGPILPTTVSHTNIQCYVQSAKMQKNRVHKFCIQNVKNYNKKARNENSIGMVSRQDPALSYPPPSVTHAVPLYMYKTTKHIYT